MAAQLVFIRLRRCFFLCDVCAIHIALDQIRPEFICKAMAKILPLWVLFGLNLNKQFLHQTFLHPLSPIAMTAPALTTEKPRILVEIKRQTQPQHDSMERSSHGASLMNGTMTLDEYKHFLAKFYGFHVPLEERLAGFSEWATHGIAIDERRRVPALKKDFLALGLSEADIAALPLCKRLPAMDTFEQICGVMYVMEGSTLGGQIQSRQIAKLFGLTPDTGAAYFSSYGAAVGPMWKEFCRLLVEVGNTESAEHVMIAAAQETFSALEAWMNEG
jgi:heme oxygenase